MALISISLAVLNLLDSGARQGHLMYYTVELLRGRPVSERTMAWVSASGWPRCPA